MKKRYIHISFSFINIQNNCISMSTIKQDRKVLEMLLNGIDPQTPAAAEQPVQAQTTQGFNKQDSSSKKQQNIIDNTAGTDFTQELMFEFDYDGTRKGLRKKCRKTVFAMVNHILPPDLTEEEYIIDKTEQDIDTLTDLYMQVELTKVMQRALVSSVQHGNMMPRNFEVYGQLADKITATNKQIVDTEQKVRKTYLDLKFEFMDKQAELGEHQEQKLIGTTQTETGIIFTSTKDLIAEAKRKHQAKLAQAQETTYVEETV